MAILGVLERHGPSRLADVARHAELSEPTAFRYLSTLVGHRVVERTGVTYSLGLRLFQLGQRAVGQPDVRKLALPHLERLLERYDETVNLAVRRRHDLVIIDVVESQRSIRKGASIGESDRWHCSGLGKSILAGLPEDEARSLLEAGGTPPLTAKTLSSVADVLQDLERIRERGYAVDDEEAEPGLRCVAAAVHDRHGDPTYAISVSAPANRMESDLLDRIGSDVHAAAAAVSAALGYEDHADAAPQPATDDQMENDPCASNRPSPAAPAAAE